MSWQLTLINRSKKHPFRVCLVVSMLITFSVLGVLRINLDVNFNDYFAHDDAGFLGLERITHKFEQRNNLLLLLENQQDWRQPKQQLLLTHFIEQLAQDSTIAQVGGYASFIDVSNIDDSILHLVKGDDANKRAKLLSYKQNPRLPLVISEDGQAILLNISFSYIGKQNFANETLWRDHNVDSLLNSTNGYWDSNKNTFVNVYLSGEQALNWQYAKVLRHDLAWFAPCLLLIITLMAFLFIRARLWLLAIGLNCVVTLMLTLGIAGWFKLTIAAISAFIPVIIITLSLAYSAHLYLAWQLALKQQNDDPLQFSFQHNKLPLFYATLTTMLGFGLLSFSPSPPIQTFGVLVAIAVLCHYLLCHSLMVVIVSSLGKRSTKKQPELLSRKDQSQIAHFPIETMAKRGIKYPTGILVSVALISTLAIFSASKLELNDDPFSYFPIENPFSQSKQKMQQYFDGVNLINYEISVNAAISDDDSSDNASGDDVSNGATQTSHSIYDKQYLSFLYQFARFLKQQPEVNRVTHIGDWVKSAGLTQSQFKRVVSENSVNTLGLGAEISADYQSSLLSIYLAPLTAKQMIAFEHQVDDWLGENKPDFTVSPALGNSLLFAHLSVENANNMLWSFAIALLMLSIILGVIKRSLIFALIGLMVNFLPLLWVFGAWQLMGGYISIGSAVVLGIMLGIIVDDTLHLLLKLPEPSKALTFDLFWPKYSAIIPVISFTSLTLVLGFGIGLASDFAPIAQLSLLSCMVISLAWLFDVLVLPVIYHQWRRYQYGQQ
ncbi:MMPL family transporter [uncultured Shewanella sp.]|uniref:efflux RND transporter permease subunit n=1 Tax=uncultured Shewanella sp. TaxID=173975 RepID=UPI00261510EC|nr:MMPL family transporter [uncultured Shewanella sp.]